MRTPIDARLRCLTALALLATSGCLTKKSTERHFYDEHIQPIFDRSCTNATSPCHKADENGIAFGNLDLTSFENVQKRRDVLRRYGTYPMPLLLLKAVPESQVTIPFRGLNLPSEIRHAGGKPLSRDSEAFSELERWLKNGANIDGIQPVETANRGVGSTCLRALPAGYTLPTVDTNATAYTTFQSDIAPFIANNCTYSTCHLSPQADFSLLCADAPDAAKFNFVQAASFIAPKGQMVEGSELLMRPLSSLKGGINHTGGVFFTTREDGTWVNWRRWALDVQDYVVAHPLSTETKSPGRTFFEGSVMPKLVARGCALEGCHSPNGFNDYRLRPGALGFLSDGALKRNYEATVNEFMALDTVDVKQSRAVKKTILTSGVSSVGTTHRGSAVLEDEGTTSDAPCPTKFPSDVDPTAVFDPTVRYDAANPKTARAFCVLKEWHRIERADRAASVSPMNPMDVLPLAFVSRPPSGDTLLQFDTYAGGADLKLADATLGADGLVTAVGNVRSGLGTCVGLAGKDVDVRGPEWSYDGTKVIFAARPGGASGLDLWLLDLSVPATPTCRQLTKDNGRLINNSVRVHNLDPVFAPDGSVVFASTRAGTLTQKYFLPNSDLFRVGPTLDFSSPQQMTFLVSSELSPAFMQDGRVSFTAEKATPDFYQLSGRRINWDLTDYHPLLAQRATSTDTFDTMTSHPSVGYQQATEIREGLDRNFLVILSDVGAKGGGGALATFNRSIGPFQADRTEVTFAKSMIVVDPAATGRAGTKGVYRSPFSLPNGEILASYAAGVTDPAAQVPKFDLVAVNEKTGARRALASDPTFSFVEGALGYKRAEKLLFQNVPQLVFGGFEGPANGQGQMHFPDLPLLGTLLGANLRHGRNVDAFKDATALKVYIDQPPQAAGAAVSGTQSVFSSRSPVGQASLESDGSVRVLVPAGKPLILEVVDKNGNPVFTMSEEHQVTSGEVITPGAPRGMFNAICAGCHGSISGQELDIAVKADALTGASLSVAHDKAASILQ